MKKDVIFPAALLIFILAGVIHAGAMTNDYSPDPGLVIIKDESGKEECHGYVAGAYYEIPSTEYGSVVLEFDISFDTVGAYGTISVGLGSREDAGKAVIEFCRSDGEFIARYKAVIEGARGLFRFLNSDGIPVQETPEVSFNQGKTYHIQMKYRKGEYVRILVDEKNKGGRLRLWESEKLKVIGQADFDRIYFGVRPGKGSAIRYEQDLHHIRLASILNPSSYALVAIVDNMLVTYEEGGQE